MGWSGMFFIVPTRPYLFRDLANASTSEVLPDFFGPTTETIFKAFPLPFSSSLLPLLHFLLLFPS
jgi:hypothetical protein